MNVVVLDHVRSSGEALVNLIRGFQAGRTGSCQLFCDYDIFKAQIMEDLAMDVCLIDVSCCDTCNLKNRGISIAEEIYRYDPRARFIFMSNSMQEHVEQIYLHDINVAGLLSIPVKKNLLFQLLSRIESQLMNEKRTYWTVQYRNTVYHIPVDDIIYLESDNHHVCIHAKGREIEVYRRLSDLEQELPENFVRCHRSYMVNMDHIEVLEANELYLKENRGSIPIGKNYKDAVREAYLNYIKQ